MDSPKRDWRHLFVTALRELESEKFVERLTAADDAVFNRLLELEDEPANHEERLALEETLEDIRLLRNSCYDFGR
jgi:hypothetical protein